MTLDAQLREGRERAKSYTARCGHEIGDFLSDGFGDEEAQRLFCVCLKCGRRAVVFVVEDEASGESILVIEGAATFKPCEPDALRALEGKAWILGHTPLLLETRLSRAIEELGEGDQGRFDPGEFQPHYGRWLSDDGLLALQWTIRDEPTQPISDDNRQSVWGTVELRALVNEDDLMPARYTGPHLDPNDAIDDDEWLVEPLEPEERGLAYRDDEDNWRFKREDGTTGFFVSPRDLVFERPWLDVEPDESERSSVDPNDAAFYP